jgi:hypothetical protein
MTQARKKIIQYSLFDRRNHHIREFGTALTTILPILFRYCYKSCYSDSRNL